MAPRKPGPAAAAAPPAAPLRRSARLANLPPTAEPTNAQARVSKKPQAPKPKAKPKKYDCTTCGRTLAASSFPEFLATAQCAHLINTCKPCSQAWIAAQLEGVAYDRVSCPECPELLTNDGVKMLAAKAVYVKFDELERRGIAEKIPGWVWCLSPKCRAGQVHEPLLKGTITAAGKGKIQDEEIKTPKRSRRGRSKRPATPLKVIDLTHEDPTFFTCHDCGARACVPCARPAHDGETCAQAQRRFKVQNDAEEKASAKLIEDRCKQCPKCGKNIEKNGGCDQVTCTQCRTPFCWICARDYGAINKSGHGEGCTYATAGAIDPHAMHGVAVGGQAPLGFAQHIVGMMLGGAAAW
ncbi:hypothetical protein LTR53_016415 [Teratosphaeriaceae sp. CCFEE 6253]|nr:hypothetical protein LTR53_016415 [Teratosphaeriaceae sp. CCFEE 6253]